MEKHLKSFLIKALLFIFICGFSIPSPAKTKGDESKSVLILGGGIGALTSAIYLQRSGIQTIVIEGPNPGGTITQSPNVHNWPGEIQIDGESLATKVRAQALANGATILSQEVIKVDFSKQPFTITTRDLASSKKTHVFRSIACILATGSTPNLLGIPGESGEKGYWARGVYNCAVCDGALYKGKTVAVIGGGDSAILEANYLAKIAKKVYVILRSNQFRTIETLRKEELIKKPNVEIIYNTKIGEIYGDGQKVLHLKLSTAKELPVDGVFIAIGATPNSKLFSGQLELDQQGYVVLKQGQQTSIPGVFAIGDLADPEFKQAISAAGDGAKAAMQIEQYLSLHSNKESSKPAPPRITPAARTYEPVKGEITELSSTEEFYAAIGPHSTPVLVDFYSPYCGPCRRLTPELKSIAEKYSEKIRFLKVNASQFSELTSNYNIYGVPTILVFDKKGKMIERGTGLEEIQVIFKKLDAIASQ